MDVPSMVQRSGDTLIVRRVVSGDQIYLDHGPEHHLIKSTTPITSSIFEGYRPRLDMDVTGGNIGDGIDEIDAQNETKDEGLPQCKIKRNYSCSSCTFFTQNPRSFLSHLRDTHGEKIVINECKLCLYASKHYQKLVRHMKMVHGSTEGIEEHSQARKRQVGREHRKRKIEESLQPAVIQPQINFPIEKYEKYEVSAHEEGPQNRLLKCSICEFTTLYRAQLVDHEQEEHYKTKFFRCEKCSYVTHIKARFSKHVKYHSMPMIKCITCDFRTPYKWNLDRHMKNHGGTGPFKCAACNFTADIKQSLTVHEMNHHVPPVGHAAGMSMAKRKNKVGATDIPEDFLSENGDMSDSYNNNNNIDDFEEPFEKKFRIDDEDQPTDLSQKPLHDGTNTSKKTIRPVPKLIPIPKLVPNLPKSIVDDFNMLANKGFTPSKSSLKDFATLFLGDEKLSAIDIPQLSPSSNCSSASKKKGSFFDKLKETFAANVSKNENMICGCGHISKCLSESILHQKSCTKEDQEKASSPSPINLSVNSGSTRCQFCRHRCKSSADLYSHLRNCSEAGHCQNNSLDSSSESNEKTDDVDGDDCTEEKHPMENRIFVWNKIPNSQTADDHSFNDQEITEDVDEERFAKDLQKTSENFIVPKKENSENSYYGVETAPGYGEVTKKMTPEEEAANSSLKKVYKCPHCSFWASTASRFHVHIVGHLNKKPFECSLCAYRSNWRWDITKHIRLKTIRDPSHKSAKVLMNDETGRRNYTKYNKYITLMKVTEEDGDPKLMKSGEMTPNQEASLAFLNEFNGIQNNNNKRDNNRNMDYCNEQNEPGPSAAAAAVAKLLPPQLNPSQLIRMPFFPNTLLGISSQLHQQDNQKRSPPPLIKPGEDVVAQNIDMKSDGSEKRTLYKCRKCNYRNVSRETVLTHVKGHYQEAGINFTQNSAPLQVAVNSNIYVKNVLAAMCLTQQQLSLNDKIVASSQGSIIGQQSHQNINQSSTQQQQQQQQQLALTVNNAVIPINMGATTASSATANEHGEADEASSGVVTTTGTGVTGWRGPAPYRCGHCHQVSNWKHVIQRHCRLKHNGDIRIETIDRNSDKTTPIYYPLNSQTTYNGSSGVNNAGSNNNNQQQTIYNNISTAQDQLLNQKLPAQPQTNSSHSSNDYRKDIKILNNDINCIDLQLKSTEGSPNSKLKHYQCPSCPFISESKSQLMYHNSLHKYKSDLYQCQQCNFSCYKKQIFHQHNKQFHDENYNNSDEMTTSDHMIQDNQYDLNDKFLTFCKYCPARYFGSKDLKLHIKMHSTQFPYHCKLCTFTARQEPNLLTHLSVHTQSYEEKTIKLMKKFKQDVEHPRPKIIQVSISATEKAWIVEQSNNNNNSNTDLEDAIEKNIICLEDSNERFVKSSSNDEEISGNSLLKRQLEIRNDLTSDEYTNSLNHCPQCPFETVEDKEYKAHLQNHSCISGQRYSLNCDHCDYTVSDEKHFKEHLLLHFKTIKNINNVAFFTKYDNLELNLIDTDNDKSKQLLFKSCENGVSTMDKDDSQEQKTIVDANTGEIISRNNNF